jgi:hypothetical protein
MIIEMGRITIRRNLIEYKGIKGGFFLFDITDAIIEAFDIKATFIRS